MLNPSGLALPLTGSGPRYALPDSPVRALPTFGGRIPRLHCTDYPPLDAYRRGMDRRFALIHHAPRLHCGYNADVARVRSTNTGLTVLMPLVSGMPDGLTYDLPG